MGEDLVNSHCEAHIHSFNNSYQMHIIKQQPLFQAVKKTSQALALQELTFWWAKITNKNETDQWMVVNAAEDHTPRIPEAQGGQWFKEKEAISCAKWR